VSALDNAKAALARREAQNRTDPFHFGLTDHMYVALAALIAEHERVLAERAAPQEWEYGVRHFDNRGFPTDMRYLSREQAERDLATCGMNCYLVRRGMTNPGPWEPLPEDTNTVECPHWSPGTITLRPGCTACAATNQTEGSQR
jgi:hypothetical protein